MALQKTPTVAEALEFAVQKVRASDYRTGRAVLAWVLQHQPENVVAWLWLARCIFNREEQLLCMQKVAALDPFNRHSR
jgi:Tfp pilus assembly protein PilF